MSTPSRPKQRATIESQPEIPNGAPAPKLAAREAQSPPPSVAPPNYDYLPRFAVPGTAAASVSASGPVSVPVIPSVSVAARPGRARATATAEAPVASELSSSGGAVGGRAETMETRVGIDEKGRAVQATTTVRLVDPQTGRVLKSRRKVTTMDPDTRQATRSNETVEEYDPITQGKVKVIEVETEIDPKTQSPARITETTHEYDPANHSVLRIVKTVKSTGSLVAKLGFETRTTTEFDPATRAQKSHRHDVAALAEGRGWHREHDCRNRL